MIALLPHCGFLSETTRMLAIARALRARGEAVVIATHGGPYTRVLDAEGEPYITLSPTMDAARCAEYVQGVVDIGRPGTRLQSIDEVRAAVSAETAFFQGHNVTKVVIGFTLTAYLSARVAGIPLAASHGGAFVPPVFEDGLAPVPTTMPMPFAEWLPSRLKRRLVNEGPMRLEAPARFLNEVAHELGVEPVPSLAALMVGDLTLVTETADVLGISRERMEGWRPATARWPTAWRRETRLVYTGPLFARLRAAIPAPVAEFLHAGEPPVYVVLSSSTPAQLRAVVARVRATGLRVLVGATIHDVGELASRDVMVAGVLPNHLVMPKARLAVTMGGQGTVQTAIASGTPLVGIPLHPEQELNVAIAARLGMARGVAPRHASQATLTAVVREVADTPAYAAAAIRAAALYRGVDGAAQAADAIIRWER